MTLHKLVVEIEGKDKTFFTLADSIDEAITKVKGHLSQAGLTGKITVCQPKPQLTFIN